jgi:CheY-like chemotaxis protein
MIGARVLLLEDDPDNLELLTMILGARFAVSSYRRPEEALAALDIVKPQALVLDIGMSPIDGVECLRRIRQVPGYQGVPALAVTAYARHAEREEFIAKGFDAVVTKPLRDELELIEQTERLLARSSDPRGYHRSAGPSDTFSFKQADLTFDCGDTISTDHELGWPSSGRPPC